MTESLQQAFEEASKLPDESQDMLAAIMMSEIASDRKWDDLLSRPESHKLLERLGKEALEEFEVGRTRELNIDDL